MKTRELLFFLLALFAAEHVTAGFRSFDWGASRADVIAGETADLKKELPASLLYVGTVLDTEMMINFDFVDDQLKEGSVSTIHWTPSPKQLELYELAVALMTRKYGEPADVSQTWHDRSLAHRPDKLELALALGHVELGHRWELEDTVIRSSINKSGDEVVVWILYTERKQDKKHLDQIEADLLDDI